MRTYFAYARVSTPRQGERGVSLPEQKAAIERYARGHNLEISRWFEEQQSASQTGRATFVQMLRLLRKGVACGVIIHKIDRSVRNLEDWADVGRLVDAGVEVHFANENVDLKTVAGRLSADIQAVVAAHYSRNLREEVKKGLYGRMKQGFYPLRAPIGYLDQGSAKLKIPDPIRAPLIQEAFNLYVSGTYSIPRLAREMFMRGLRNLKGGKVSVNGWATVLKNPFYAGVIRILKNGQTYAGNHEPLISSEDFSIVQAVLSGKRSDGQRRYVFRYSRIARCGTCGYSLIGEKQKGHVYYRCHDRPFKEPPHCPPTSVREERLDDVVCGTLAPIDLTDIELALVRQMIQEMKAKSVANRDAQLNSSRLHLDQIQQSIAKLTDFLIDGSIDKSMFDDKKYRLLLERSRIQQELADLEHGRCASLERLENTVELAKSPSQLYRKGSSEKRRELLKILLSNLTVREKKIEITLAPAFGIIAQRQKDSNCRPYRGTCRTWEGLLHKIIKYFEDIQLKGAEATQP
jgi:site-specific DNA recombinase